MNRFLRETWELFYWAMFCPSKLQQRMNEWCPAKEKDGKRPDTNSSDILLFRFNFRFVAQYFLLLVCLSLPLIINITIQGRGIDGLQIPIVLLTAYHVSHFSFLSIGLPIPLIWLIVYRQQPKFWLTGLNEALNILPPFSQIAFGLTAVTVFLVITNVLTSWFLQSNRLSLSRTIFVMGGAVSFFLGSWLATENWLFVLLASGCSAFLFFAVKDQLNTDKDMVGVAVAVVFVVAFVLAFVLAFLVAGAVAGAGAGAVAGAVAFVLAFLVAFVLAFVLVFLVAFVLAFVLAVFLAFVLAVLLAFILVFVLVVRVPGVVMKAFQQMQALLLPGLQPTIKQALPEIIADQLTTVKTLAEVVSIPNPDHPLLPLLVPTFYELDSEAENAPPPEPSPYIKAEISIMLPRFQGVARDVEAALEASNPALRERGLERVLERLARLSTQLPGLGLKPPEIKRWQPVITRWQRVIELELEEQQKQSQGERLNPFQFGNPVRLNRDYLFKGRRKFADDIVRRILNSDRPTLILYGPRRCGKTSFLYNLPRLFPRDVLPVFLDMQSAAITTSEADFCQGLVRAMYKDSKSQGVLLPTPPKRNEFKNSPYTVLEDWLDEALEKLEDRQLLLNLDEFEKIGTAINEGQISLKLFDELRHLIQHYDQLGFLFSGVKNLEEIGPHWSSYFISVVPIEMLYLEPEEARELLLDPDPEFTVRYDKGIVEEVLKLTRCQPYLLQLLGAAMVTQANLHHTDTITKQLLQAAIEDSFINGEPYFTNVWTEFTGESEEEILAGQNFLINLAKGEQPNTNRNDITEKALQYMVRHHIIEQIDSQYNFEIPLVKMWVQHRTQ